MKFLCNEPLWWRDHWSVPGYRPFCAVLGIFPFRTELFQRQGLGVKGFPGCPGLDESTRKSGNFSYQICLGEVDEVMICLGEVDEVMICLGEVDDHLLENGCL